MEYALADLVVDLAFIAFPIRLVAVGILLGHFYQFLDAKLGEALVYVFAASDALIIDQDIGLAVDVRLLVLRALAIWHLVFKRRLTPRRFHLLQCLRRVVFHLSD